MTNDEIKRISFILAETVLTFLFIIKSSIVVRDPHRLFLLGSS